MNVSDKIIFLTENIEYLPTLIIHNVKNQYQPNTRTCYRLSTIIIKSTYKHSFFFRMRKKSKYFITFDFDTTSLREYVSPTANATFQFRIFSGLLQHTPCSKFLFSLFVYSHSSSSANYFLGKIALDRKRSQMKRIHSRVIFTHCKRETCTPQAHRNSYFDTDDDKIMRKENSTIKSVNSLNECILQYSEYIQYSTFDFLKYLSPITTINGQKQCKCKARVETEFQFQKWIEEERIEICIIIV